MHMNLLKGLEKKMKVTEWTYWGDNRFQNIDDVLLEDFVCIEDAVIENIIENGYKFSGKDHQWGYCPVVDDKYIYCVSMRKWGSIMQRAYSLPNDDGMGYVLWAWATPVGEKPIYPKMTCGKCDTFTLSGDHLGFCNHDACFAEDDKITKDTSESCRYFRPKRISEGI